MHSVSSSMPGKTIIAADFILSRLSNLNLLKTDVEIRPNAGMRMIYKTTITNGLSTIKKYCPATLNNIVADSQTEKPTIKLNSR